MVSSRAISSLAQKTQTIATVSPLISTSSLAPSLSSPASLSSSVGCFRRTLSNRPDVKRNPSVSTLTSSPGASSSSPSPSLSDVTKETAEQSHHSRPSGSRPAASRKVWSTLGWFSVAAFITSHVCSIGNVTGGSMSPTFNGPYQEASAANTKSDVVLLNRWAAATLSLKVGDIVTLISPLDPKMLLTKRIIALPDDVVRVWAPSKSGVGGKWTRIKIPPGNVWVEGDAVVDIVPGSLARAARGQNGHSGQGKSRDSREFGPVPLGLITSRIDLVLWPPKRFGKPAPRPSVQTSANQYPPSLSSSLNSLATATTRYPDDPVGDFATQVHPSLARLLDEMKANNHAKAHPDDSIVSPYLDWPDEIVRDVAQPPVNPEVRQFWNSMSRGGSLGDDAAEQ